MPAAASGGRHGKLDGDNESFGSDPVSYQWTVVGATSRQSDPAGGGTDAAPRRPGGMVTASVVVRDHPDRVYHNGLGYVYGSERRTG